MNTSRKDKQFAISNFNLGYRNAMQRIMELLESDSIDWGSYIKGKGEYLHFDSKGFIKQFKRKLK